MSDYGLPIDPQVEVAARELTDAEKDTNQPWLFADGSTGGVQYGRWAKGMPYPAPYIRLDIALTALDRLSGRVTVTPAAWQRRLKFPREAGAVSQWEQCSSREATGHFERRPEYEYRPLYAHPDTAPAPSPDQIRREALREAALIAREAGYEADRNAEINIALAIADDIEALITGGDDDDSNP